LIVPVWVNADVYGGINCGWKDLVRLSANWYALLGHTAKDAIEVRWLPCPPSDYTRDCRVSGADLRWLTMWEIATTPRASRLRFYAAMQNQWTKGMLF